MKIKNFFALFFLLWYSYINGQVSQPETYTDPYRPQFHFSPREHWMNDPNGMVYYKGVYHLFYQYYPGGTVWGPMHWGHATSADLFHWKELPIALYPDSLGYIFSGSIVVDEKNTSGFGENGKIPLVAIFTHHDPNGARERKNTYQNQSLAYSLDEGKTWTKYSGNPVLKNPGIRDFRDPKVSWNEVANRWIMTLATLDRITFYSSPDLKDWKKESEFGKEVGAHGGVWECPDLFSLNYQGRKLWVLIVNLNPGGPNGGSATQYFVGDFDGHQFKPFTTDTKWLDYGPDEYAGVTYANTGNRRIFLGWMSNWQYARLVPTEKWRSAMTIARELSFQKLGENYLLTSRPVSELEKIIDKRIVLKAVSASGLDLSGKLGNISGPARLKLSGDRLESFTISFSNELGENLLVGYDKSANQYFIDRTHSGKVDFHKNFAGRHSVPRFASKNNLDMTLIIDDASIELFADNGLSVMTEIFFPGKPYSRISLESAQHFKINTVEYNKLKSVWK